MNYDEYLNHLAHANWRKETFDESKVKRDKGGRFARKAEARESKADTKKRLRGFDEEVRTSNQQTRSDLRTKGAAAAVKNAKKRARKENIRSKISSVLNRVTGKKKRQTAMNRPDFLQTKYDLQNKGAASAVKGAKKRAKKEEISNKLNSIRDKFSTTGKKDKVTKDMIKQPYKNGKTMNTKQKVVATFLAAKRGASSAIKNIKSKISGFIEKLGRKTERDLLNKGAASAVKNAKNRAERTATLNNAKGKIKEYAARGSVYVDRVLNNASYQGKKAASKAYNTARRAGMDLRDDAELAAKKVREKISDASVTPNDIRSARTNYQKAEGAYDRIRQAVRDGEASTSELESARENFQKAKGKYDDMKNAVSSARSNYQKAEGKYERIRQAVKNGEADGSELESARVAFQKAKSKYERLNSAIKSNS